MALHLQHLHRDRYSPATIRERGRVLRSLPGLTPDRAVIETWWSSRQQLASGEDRAATSLAAERSHARSFYAWAIERELVTANPIDWLPKVRQKTTTPRPTRESDLGKAYAAADPEMRRILALGAMAGLRSAEIAAITWQDIDPDAGVLRVRNGKGGKDRSIPLSADLLDALGEPSAGPVVGEALSAKAVSARVSRFLRSQGVESSAHKLRARFATRFLAETGDLEATRAVLGHASVATTQRYVIASSDVMKRGAAAAGRIG